MTHKKVSFYSLILCIFLGVCFISASGQELCSAHQKSVLFEQEIRELYKNFVAVNFTPEYAQRYANFSSIKNTKNWRWEGKDFPRVIALLEFSKFISEHNIISQKALFINGDDPESEYLSTQYKKIIEYVDNPKKHDLHNLQLDEYDFDFVMVNQTLEHLYDPILCLKNIYKYMKPGGILYFNVPTLNIPHDMPFYYYTGYMPTGAAAITKLAGFTILSIGQWGNQTYIKQVFEKLTWPDYLSLQREDVNFAINDVKRPVITWVFARKE